MKQIFWLLFCFFIVTGTAFAQFPANPNKIRLGNQTTGDGLLYRTAGSPAYTPTGINNAWVAFDTVAGVLYYYEGGTWNSFTSGGSGIDSIAYASDTLYIYTPSETFKAEIIAGSAPNLTFTNALGPVKLSAGADSVSFDDGAGISVSQAGGVLIHNLTNVGTAGTYTSVTTDAQGRVTAGTNPGFVTVVDSTRLAPSDSVLVYYQNGVELRRDTIRVPGGGGGSGTVTSISAGNGISVSPSPITTTGTVSADTSVLASKTWVSGRGYASATGTANKVAKFTATNTLGNGLLTDDGTRVSIDDGGALTAKMIRLDSWLTANRTATPLTGDIGWNINTNRLDIYNGTTWLLGATQTAAIASTQVAHADANGHLQGSSALTWNGHTLTVLRPTYSNVFISGGNTTNTSSSSNALGNGALGALTSGTLNNAFGSFALQNVTTGADNVAMGHTSGSNITTGGRNFALGTFTMQSALGAANSNIGIGYSVLRYVRGNNNVAIGSVAGGEIRTASDNVFIGYLAGYNATVADSLTGSNNILIGSSSGTNIAGAAAKNIVIGQNINLPTANGSNQIVIGNLIFGTGASGTGTTIPAGSRVGIRVAAPTRAFQVNGVARFDSLATFQASTDRFITANSTGDAAHNFFGSEIGRKTNDTIALLQQGATTGQALAWNGSNWRPATISGSVADGDKGDIDVTSSGAVWTVDTNAITTVKIADGAVTSDKLASHSAGGTKLGALTYISADDTDVNLSTYLSVDWLANYSQLVVWLRLASANRTVTFPTPSSTYQGKVVEIFFGNTNYTSYTGSVTSATGRITAQDVGTNVTTHNSYDGGSGLIYAKIICAQDPNSGAYQWLVLDSRGH
jgi:hypothetical protein